MYYSTTDYVCMQKHVALVCIIVYDDVLCTHTTWWLLVLKARHLNWWLCLICAWASAAGMGNFSLDFKTRMHGDEWWTYIAYIHTYNIVPLLVPLLVLKAMLLDGFALFVPEQALVGWVDFLLDFKIIWWWTMNLHCVHAHYIHTIPSSQG